MACVRHNHGIQRRLLSDRGDLSGLEYTLSRFTKPRKNVPSQGLHCTVPPAMETGKAGNNVQAGWMARPAYDRGPSVQQWSTDVNLVDTQSPCHAVPEALPYSKNTPWVAWRPLGSGRSTRGSSVRTLCPSIAPRQKRRVPYWRRPAISSLCSSPSTCGRRIGLSGWQLYLTADTSRRLDDQHIKPIAHLVINRVSLTQSYRDVRKKTGF